MKVKAETHIPMPINVSPEDTITLEYRKQYYDLETGKVIAENRIPVLEEKIEKEMTLTKGIVLEFEESDGLGGIGIGGAFIQEKEMK